MSDPISATENYCLEPIPSQNMKSKTYTFSKSAKRHNNLKLLTLGIIVSISLLILTSFLVYNSVYVSQKLSHFKFFLWCNGTTNTTFISNNTCDCVDAYRQQMMLVESWQSNGTQSFFHECRHQYPLGGLDYLSICNTSAPGKPLYDIRYFISGKNSFYPTIRGFSLNTAQTHKLLQTLIQILPAMTL